MSIEQEIFHRRTVTFEALPAFGFRKDGCGYFYAKTFMGGEFRAEVRIDGNGRISGTVVAADSGEEYLPLRIEYSSGAFVGEVREQYRRILESIAEACTVKNPFLFAQSNRIARLIHEQMGETPDYPFRGKPGIGVFRFPQNRKWYGIVMLLRKNRLTRTESDGDRDVEVLNVKADARKIPALLAIPGIFPGYHMNRANWISILLDGTVTDELVLELLKESRNFTVRGGKKIRPHGVTVSWIVPANPRYYDIEPDFKKKTGLLWKQGAGIRPGDTVFIYVGAPLSSIRYKCIVRETGLPFEYDDANIHMKQAMKMDLLEEYPAGFCTASVMRDLGIYAVRGPRTAPEALLAYLMRAGNI